MSALELIDHTLAQLSAEVAGWRLWAARKVCDCEAQVNCRGEELADWKRHRAGCRYRLVALDISEGV